MAHEGTRRWSGAWLGCDDLGRRPPGVRDPAGDRKDPDVLISTMNDVPGYKVTRVLGECFGLTVRARNVFSQFGAGLKSIVGGELAGMTKNLERSRQEVIDRMVQVAESKGANAVLSMRFDTSEMANNWTEICAYGTAVVVEPA